MKDTAIAGLEAGGMEAWRHVAALEHAAPRMRCAVGCDPRICRSRVHARYGSRSHVVSASRRTKHRTGWSFTALTRGVQRRLRAEWALAQSGPQGDQTETATSSLTARDARRCRSTRPSGRAAIALGVTAGPPCA